MINTKFWSDSWVRQKLNPLDRYLFLYFITNEHTNICGIYELPIEIIAFETGIDENDLKKTYFQRLKPKIVYKNNWVIIPNFPNYQNYQENLKVKRGIELAIKEIPAKICEIAISYGYPMDTLSIPHPYPSLNPNPNSNSNSNPNKGVDGLFDKFWSPYPKKKSKPAALRAFKRLNPNQSLLETILKDIEKRKKTNQWQKQNGQFIPYPATYLNNRKWEDEDDQSSDWRYM